MEKSAKQSFLSGMFLGSLVTAMIMLIGVAAITVYARQSRWNGVDPNTKIIEIYSLLNRFSIVPFDKDVMLENMYRGFLDGVDDPYTQYLDAEAIAAFRARISGTFVGIGITLSSEADDPYVTVSSTFRGAPAENAGVLPGDRILRVDGNDVAGRTREDVVGMITGPEGTPVTISFFREYENKRFDVEITRARIEVPKVFHEMMYTDSGAVGYIRIEGFDEVTSGQFYDALSELYADGMNGLVLDLRNNPGGSLCVVNEITDRLIPEGIITFTIDAQGRREYHYSGPDNLGLPLVLLVNGRSASASEILSGAVRDTEIGTIVGTRTFGKGVVQNVINLSDGTAVKLTVQTYHTPLGECIHGVGIEPHIVVEMSEDLSRRIGRLAPGEDVQLQVALEVIAGKF
ncbi:MAG: S41 family peptidase [Defluviitaleaceae bacterium]|nr:S41 family peptidase [Defluviitaleaceae bacterium]